MPTIQPLPAPHAPGIRTRRFTPGGRPARYWYRGNLPLTHRANGVNLVFPEGERFFIRSVVHYLDRITDPVLRARVKAFVAQEAQHGRAHEQGFRDLEAEGFEVQSWLAWYNRIAWGRLEPLAPPLLRLSVTAALEHLTATMATDALSTDLLEGVDPEMRDLLQWHATEEIEHKDVAYDVLVAMGGGYGVRAVGMAVAVVGLLGFWSSGYRHLLRQDPQATPERLRQDDVSAEMGRFRREVVRTALRTWFRPGFHPNEVDNRGLAQDWLAARGAA